MVPLVPTNSGFQNQKSQILGTYLDPLDVCWYEIASGAVAAVRFRLLRRFGTIALEKGPERTYCSVPVEPDVL